MCYETHRKDTETKRRRYVTRETEVGVTGPQVKEYKSLRRDLVADTRISDFWPRAL